MKNFLLLKNFLFLGVIIVIGACETEREFSLSPQEKLVLLSNISPDKPIELSLSLSKSFTDTTQRPFIHPQSAAIFLYEEDKFLGEFQYKTPTLEKPENYYINIQPREEVNYSIRATYADFPEISANTTVPASLKAEISAIMVGDSSVSEGKIVHTELQFSSFEKKYLHLRSWRQPFSADSTQSIVEDLPVQVQNVVNFTELFHQVGILIEYQPTTNTPNFMEVILPSIISSMPDTSRWQYFLEINLVNLDYYLFHQSLSNQVLSNSQQRPIFDSSPPLIYTNVEAGLGNFSAYTSIVLDFVD